MMMHDAMCLTVPPRYPGPGSVFLDEKLILLPLGFPSRPGWPGPAGTGVNPAALGREVG
jgi:hypothetical protein